MTYQMAATAPGKLDRVTNGFRIDKPYTNQHMDATAMSARGMGLRSPRLPSLLAARTADMGEKYRRVLVMTPSRGMSDAMRGFDVISREVPPPRIRIDSFTMLLLIGSNLLARGRVGWLPFRRIGLDLGLQAYDGIKMLIGPTESSSSRRVDFICRAMRGTTRVIEL